MPEVGLEPMSEEEYAENRMRSAVRYGAEFAASRALSISDGRRQAAEEHERLLPEGVRTSGCRRRLKMRP